MAGSLGLDLDELSEFYAAFFAQLDVDVELVIVDGALRSLRTQADMSGLFAELFSESSPLASDLSAAERQEAASLFSDAEQFVETLVTFEIDDSIVVAPPAGEFEDRTQMLLDYVELLRPR
jgi:hypothetical protein